VDPATGAWSIVGQFNWPEEIFGCPILYDPTITFDRASGNLYLDFTDDFGLIITLNVPKAHVVRTVEPSDPFFVGFVTMAYQPTGGNLVGLQPHVEESGFCSDGCFQLGLLSPVTGGYLGLLDVPFKAMMDDSHYLDSDNHIFWVQASYDLRTKTCGPADSSLCLLAINSRTGALINATYTPDFTVYKYAQQAEQRNVFSWVFGFVDTCQDPYNDFAFASVTLDAGTAKLVNCIQHNVTVHMDEWITSFSTDDSLLATGSGDAEATAQLLIFETATGKARINSNLTGLAQALHAAEGLFDIWSVDFY